MNEPVHPRDVSVAHACRFCGSPLDDLVVDLGVSPLCESFLRADQLDEMEPFYPLRVMVCARCFLVQLPAYVTPEADLLRVRLLLVVLRQLARARPALRRAMIATRFDLASDSLVVELGSNDGYLLQNFVAAGSRASASSRPRTWRGAAEARAFRRSSEFFGRELARELVARRARGRPHRRQQRAGAGARPQRLRGRHRDAAGARRASSRSRSRTSCGSSTRTSSTRSTTSTSRTSRCARASGSSPRHGLTSSTSTSSPTHGGSLRVYARHVGAGRSRSRRGSQRVRGARSGAGLEDVATYAAFGDRVSSDSKRCSSSS